MKRNIVRLTTYLIPFMVTMFFLACPAPTVPTAPTYEEPTPTTAILTVKLAPACINQASNVEVYVDNNYIATLQPGNQTQKTVSIGDHVVFARSQEGLTWTNTTIHVGSNGYIYTLNCH